ncbi:hypothetical protein Bbelb_109340 [Branchiostoma belcheri]|nr:hypothetical protein Bbelb_109340 [Branchiostoma belcheri]
MQWSGCCVGLHMLNGGGDALDARRACRRTPVGLASARGEFPTPRGFDWVPDEPAATGNGREDEVFPRQAQVTRLQSRGNRNGIMMTETRDDFLSWPYGDGHCLRLLEPTGGVRGSRLDQMENEMRDMKVFCRGEHAESTRRSGRGRLHPRSPRDAEKGTHSGFNDEMRRLEVRLAAAYLEHQTGATRRARRLVLSLCRIRAAQGAETKVRSALCEY